MESLPEGGKKAGQWGGIKEQGGGNEAPAVYFTTEVKGTSEISGDKQEYISEENCRVKYLSLEVMASYKEKMK